ncbi:SynChlorMet cassette radical SAM/SPASM protein ScmE [Desulfonema limicola]|uniref:SynChlorMet cassette radical SAM/SPASM protein ScmE n=1 Tax=Desulfonema limicola TaxID=45656 RepID=UPI001A9BCF0C|nr:SynChlorMet cassette radical SAM/SPASM protein ScmE [Desulfonema limicola]
MRRDLKELIHGIAENRMRFSILSNAVLINDDIAGFIAQTRRCDMVQVSLDGSSSGIHDLSRGKGSFTKAVLGIKTLQKHNINVSVRVTVNHNNVDDLDNIAFFLLEELGLDSFSTNSAILLGSCRLNPEHIMLSIQEQQKAMEKMAALADKYKGRISASAGPLAEVRYWNEMHKAYINNAPSFPDGGYLTGCRCTQSKITIRADGVIVPCSMLAHMELGRINQDSLADIWQNSPVLNQIRSRSAISLKEFEFCRGCVYIPYCTGNCPGLAYSITGQINHPSPDSCLKRFLDAGGEIPGKDL